MKGCLAVLAFVLVAAVAVVGFVVFLQRGSTDEEALTRQARAEVVGSEFEYDAEGSQQRGYAVDLRYRVDGTWYATDSWVPEDQWTPSQGPVAICVDPEDPASVVVPTRPDAECGESTVGRNDPERAEVSSAP